MFPITFCSTFVLVYVLLGTTFALDENVDDISQNDVENETRVVNPNIENMLRTILKNGINGALPPLDPLEIETFELDPLELSGSLILDRLILEGLKLNGLSSFTATELNANILLLRLTFDLSFSLDAQAEYLDLDATVGDILPFFGNGSVELGLDLRLNGTLRLGYENGFVIIGTLLVDITFGDMTFSLSNIMDFGGTREAVVFNKVMGDVTPQILNLTLGSLKDSLIASIVEIVNNYLRNELQLTGPDLIACLNGSPQCPIQI
ncbi:hypothetical protein C0J52_04597 [Blattella germanica]|nr:hypothetical protein C0J52_04597 [Blattella germanica]